MIDELLRNRILFEEPNDNGAGQDASSDDGSQDEPETFDRDYVQKLRAESAKYRTKAKELEENVNKLKGLESKVKSIFGDDQDPAKELEAIRTENSQLKLEKKLSIASKAHNADQELVTAYLLHKGEINADMEQDAINEIVKSAVESNTRLKMEQPKTVGDGEGGDEPKGKLTMNELIRKAAGR